MECPSLEKHQSAMHTHTTTTYYTTTTTVKRVSDTLTHANKGDTRTHTYTHLQRSVSDTVSRDSAYTAV